MIVDVLTFFILTTLVTVVSATVLTLIRYFHGKQAALDCWIIASYAQVLSLAIHIAVSAPSALSLLFQNALFAGAFLFVTAGHHFYLRLPLKVGRLATTLVLYCSIIWYFSSIEPSLQNRAIVFSSSAALCCFYNAYLYLNHWRQKPSNALWIVIVLYLFFGSCFAIRGWITLQAEAYNQHLLLGVPGLLSLALFVGNALQTYVFYFLLHWRQVVQLEQFANYDITGAMRRSYFIQQLTKLTQRAEFSGDQVCVIFIDLDRFKSINDDYGHDYGDQALMHFSQIASRNLRAGDLFGRFGGEEFIIALNHTTSEQAYALANRIRCQLHQQALASNKGKIFMSASFGIATSKSSSELSDLINHADQAMYHAKNQGGNRVNLYDNLEVV
ncbi:MULTISPECIES: GGDEF domain-containing protein [unclassified Agarivorans]|uniref:GGDEF domain-containing protein n=1 Tax=unclassified Agarivorans TaxID=2636026 RepID=UPI003D7E81E8